LRGTPPEYVRNNREEMVKLLINSGADVDVWSVRVARLKYPMALSQTQRAELLRMESEARKGKH
jgi:hypothetical protein